MILFTCVRRVSSFCFLLVVTLLSTFPLSSSTPLPYAQRLQKHLRHESATTWRTRGRRKNLSKYPHLDGLASRLVIGAAVRVSEEDNVELEHPTVGDAVRAAGEGEEVEQSSNRRVTPKESVSQAVVDSEDKRENGEYVSREVKGSANAPANDKQQQTDMKIPIRTETLSRYKTADTNSTAILDSVKNANNSTTNAPQANSTSSATLSPKNTTSTTTTDQDTKENKDLLDLKPTGPMSASQMIAEARSQSNKLLKGSFIEFVEWLFVIILVAPGTFPAMACIVLSCATFWRRRLGIPSPLEGPGRSSDAEGDGGEWDEPVGHLRAGVGSGEHGALIARGRSSGGG